MLPDHQAWDMAQAFGVSRETYERLRAGEALLERWSRKINLVGKRGDDAFWSHDVADAVFLSELLDGAGSSTDDPFVDWGSGAGIPGLLCAVHANRPVRSVEATGRKCVFQTQFAAALGLTPDLFTIVNARIEDDGSDVRCPVTARALTDLVSLIEYQRTTRPNASVCYFFKGERYEAELDCLADRARERCEAIPHPRRPGSFVVRYIPSGGESDDDSRETSDSVG